VLFIDGGHGKVVLMGMHTLLHQRFNLHGQQSQERGDAKEHFTLWALVKRTKVSSNLIDEEQKFVCLAFTLDANDQQPPKHPYTCKL
jgi:hypothetical protein